MTDNNEGHLPESGAAEDDASLLGGRGRVGGQNEMAGLVLLINTALGGLGTLYGTTKSADITFVSALLVLLIIIVVLVVKRVARPGGGPEGESRGGK